LVVLDSIEEITGKRPGFFNVDIDNTEKLKTVFDEIGENAQSIIHFAAKKAVGESVQQPLEYYRNNLDSLINILIEMNRSKVQNLVFSSSCTVYGQPDVCPVTELTPRKEAESPYGNTKAMCEDIIRDTSKAQSLNSIALRYFNPIGAHKSAKIGELPVGVPNNLVPYVTQTAAGIREELTIFGDDYDTEDGTCIRDYIHVVDLAKAHVQALRKLEAEKANQSYDVFNIGTGKGSSVLEVVNAFEKATGVSVKRKLGPRRGGDITAVYADTAKANQELNWNSELGLEESLKSSWNWEQNYRSKKA
ncbi:MAG: UDP-glucose 4-epimerase GalE, partial [Flavobacteriales bacterium]